MINDECRFGVLFHAVSPGSGRGAGAPRQKQAHHSYTGTQADFERKVSTLLNAFRGTIVEMESFRSRLHAIRKLQ